MALFTTVLSAQTAKPEEVGLSSERLKRIHDLIERRIEQRDISGAVTLVARRGRVAHLEAQGLMDIETNKPMAKDAIFRIASMTKPVVGVAVLMMIEEGKVRLSDPVSKFIPEFKDLKVAVSQSPQGARGTAPRFYTGARGTGDHGQGLTDAYIGIGKRHDQHSRSSKVPAQTWRHIG
jgi:CubicO group peptidase (beta-lactamase class C family)